LFGDNRLGRSEKRINFYFRSLYKVLLLHVNETNVMGSTLQEAVINVQRVPNGFWVIHKADNQHIDN
jgi:hypothetical protein